ncbi:hypothetical protein MRB53_031780 [Persea americana]|uniref:Uncharacterized protein n=1 Tax=Persea americana TaxID=3435 RepID=A0ACC2KQ56_PERAE|nr:hypothetical protein MRB53_031780 [Persea americana]
MATQERLAKIGREAFDLLEGHQLAPKKRPAFPVQPYPPAPPRDRTVLPAPLRNGAIAMDGSTEFNTYTHKRHMNGRPIRRGDTAGADVDRNGFLFFQSPPKREKRLKSGRRTENSFRTFIIWFFSLSPFANRSSLSLPGGRPTVIAHLSRAQSPDGPSSLSLTIVSSSSPSRKKFTGTAAGTFSFSATSQEISLRGSIPLLETSCGILLEELEERFDIECIIRCCRPKCCLLQNCRTAPIAAVSLLQDKRIQMRRTD